jgi:2-dehydro-3-deoxyphosphogluconate aldolase/(4S)-4-hydroxy-2-oxoglutarate aldolase
MAASPSGDWKGCTVDREEFLAALRRERVVAIARGGMPDVLVDALRVIADEGLCVAEVSLSSPGALDALTEAADRLADRIVLGAGPVIDAS